MAAAAKAKAPPIPAGVAAVGVDARRYHPQPGTVVLEGGAQAETELAGRLPDNDPGGPAELVIIAVPVGHLEETLDRVRKALR